MAQIFNIYFTYDDVPHSAMVSVRKTHFFLEYTLHNLTDDLLQQLPGNRIISRSVNDFIFQHASPEHQTDLMVTLLKVVSEHSMVNQD